ncbi:sigma-70 family RNA polymerase sigma factor [Rhodohalobacter sp. SW132]|uniref:RNA polymerase sigma factor n=1 Tax=Rhodohalobacter sp. SW132 TaxID=2293433 RepID=UPI000E23CA7E|nr:sigma-70 family RNA polymerase sigma factor [Rhodohalobacter sp. SW132]REL33061.1 sigma-70 family RNA polymerase sigma factor [Rhodohalobacter sp. SW132]
MFLQSDHSYNSGQWNDEDLWKEFLNGRQEALGEVFLRYYTRLYNYGMKLMHSDDMVKDGVQELFLKLWNNRESVDHAKCVEFYLLFSLRRILFDQKKKSMSIHRRDQIYMSMNSDTLQSMEESIVEGELESERYRKFNKAMKLLTGRQKEVLYLRLQHGLTNHEIAILLDLSDQSIKNYVYEAIKHLRESIYGHLLIEEF